MKEQNIPTNLFPSIGKVNVLEANEGLARRAAMTRWLQTAKMSGANTWLLTADRGREGLWAGLQELLIDLVPQIQAHAPHLIIQHNYELTRILPSLRQTLGVRYPSLTDLADNYEQIRNYPADRAFRIVHGNLAIEEQTFHQTANRNGLALIPVRQGKHQEAISLCQWCLEQINGVYGAEKHRLYRSILLFNIAQIYNFIGDYEQAIHYLSITIDLDPNYSEYWNLRGNWYFNMGDIAQALTNYLHAIELSAPYSEVWANVGQCYRRLGDDKHAIAAYSRSLDLYPQQFSVLVARAQAYENLGEFNAALADYHTALTLEPDRALVLANRAILRYELGDVSAAIQDFDRAIALEPDNIDLHQYRSIALASLK